MITFSDSRNLASLSWKSQWTGIRLKYGVKLINDKAETVFNYVGLENVESWIGRLTQHGEPSESDDDESAATGNRFYSGNVLFGKLRPYLAKAFVAKADGCCTSELLVFRPLEYDSDYLKYLILTPDFVNLINSSTYGAKMPRANWDFIGNVFLPTPPLKQQKSIAHFLDRKTAAIDTLIAKKQRLIQLLEEKRTALINQAVTKGLNPNTPMKDSGIPWIGEIPEHWRLVKIGYFAQVGNGSTPKRDKADYWSSEGFPWLNSSKINEEIIYSSDQYVSKKALEECHLPIVPTESVLVAITGEGQTRGRSAVLKFQTTINQHLAYIKPIGSHLHSEYLWRQLQSAYQWLRSESSGGGSTRAALTCEFLKEMKVPLPPLEEQIQIIHTVDERIQMINHLTEKTVTSVEKLQEYRRSLITAAVTGKIDITEVEPDV
jgi:type I restriction enzyme, S subunit